MALISHLNEFVAGLDSAVDGALFKGAEHILGESNKIVPHEYGNLETSGHTSVSDGKASVYYESVYARRQHEELTWKHDPGREAKYLEKAGRRNAGKVEQLIARTLEQEGGG